MPTIDYKIENFSDAIILPDDHKLSDSAIEAMKQDRYNRWKAFLLATPTDDAAPTVEE